MSTAATDRAVLLLTAAGAVISLVYIGASLSGARAVTAAAAAGIALALPVVVDAGARRPRLGASIGRRAIVAALAADAVLLVSFAARGDASDPWHVVATTVAAVTVVAATAVVLERGGPVWGPAIAALAVTGVVAVFAAATAWAPVNDVQIFQQRGVEVLLSGGDPYASGIFRDPFVPEASARFYGPGLSRDGLLQFGFPYTPFSLLLAVPAVVLGEVSHLHLAAAIVAAVAVVALGRRSPVAVAAAALVLLSPTTASIVINTWTDGLVAALLLLLVLAWDRDRTLVADVLLGLLLATKQYTVLLVPIHLVLTARRGGRPLRSVLVAGATAGVVALPFLARNPDGFVFSTVTLQFLQPFRPDSISLLYALGSDPPVWTGALAFLLAAAATWIVLRRVRADAVGYLSAAVVVTTVFFVWNKQAFLNYYQVVIVAMAGLAARTSVDDRTVAMFGGRRDASVPSVDAPTRRAPGS